MNLFDKDMTEIYVSVILYLNISINGNTQE